MVGALTEEVSDLNRKTNAVEGSTEVQVRKFSKKRIVIFKIFYSNWTYTQQPQTVRMTRSAAARLNNVQLTDREKCDAKVGAFTKEISDTNKRMNTPICPSINVSNRNFHDGGNSEF